METLYFCHYVHNVMDVITLPVNLSTGTSGLSILLHGVITLPDATSYDDSYKPSNPYSLSILVRFLEMANIIVLYTLFQLCS